MENLFWIVSGIVTFGSIAPIFQRIEQTGYFKMDEPDWRNRTWTHDDCKDIMKATDSKLNEHQLCAGLSDFNRVVSSDVLNKWCDFCAIKDSKIISITLSSVMNFCMFCVMFL